MCARVPILQQKSSDEKILKSALITAPTVEKVGISVNTGSFIIEAYIGAPLLQNLAQSTFFGVILTVWIVTSADFNIFYRSFFCKIRSLAHIFNKKSFFWPLTAELRPVRFPKIRFLGHSGVPYIQFFENHTGCSSAVSGPNKTFFLKIFPKVPILHQKSSNQKILKCARVIVHAVKMTPKTCFEPRFIIKAYNLNVRGYYKTSGACINIDLFNRMGRNSHTFKYSFIGASLF